MRESVAVIAEPDFSAEEAIEKSKISDRERNPNQPPDQADVQAVGAGLGVLDREAVARIRACGEKDRVERERRPAKSADDIEARC